MWWGYGNATTGISFFNTSNYQGITVASLQNWSNRYVGKEYATLMNDEVLPAFYEMNADVGFRLNDIGFAKAPDGNAKPTIGKYGTLIPGTAPAYFVGEGFAAIVTVKTAF